VPPFFSFWLGRAFLCALVTYTWSAWSLTFMVHLVTSLDYGCTKLDVRAVRLGGPGGADERKSRARQSGARKDQMP